MQDVIAFETKLAEITIPPEERRDEEKLYTLMSLSELQRKAPMVRTSSCRKFWFLSSLVAKGYNVRIARPIYKNSR